MGGSRGMSHRQDKRGCAGEKCGTRHVHRPKNGPRTKQATPRIRPIATSSPRLCDCSLPCASPTFCVRSPRCPRAVEGTLSRLEPALASKQSQASGDARLKTGTRRPAYLLPARFPCDEYWNEAACASARTEPSGCISTG